MTNGTSIYTSGNETEVNIESGKRNFTFNATDFNNLWIHFTADPSYKDTLPNFKVLIGLRELEKPDDETETVTEEDEDEDEDFGQEAIKIPPKKTITLNE